MLKMKTAPCAVCDNEEELKRIHRSSESGLNTPVPLTIIEVKEREKHYDSILFG